jgi:hypothetical protein
VAPKAPPVKLPEPGTPKQKLTLLAAFFAKPLL